MKRPFHKGANHKLFDFAKQMRKEPTLAEKLLWKALKKKQLGGFRFRQQHPIGRFILDFYCHEKKLGIELDGKYHNDSSQQELDEHRTEDLNCYGIQIIRFKNEDVIHQLPMVLDIILDRLLG